MSKELLQQALHGWDEGSSDNAIEVHIHNLRKNCRIIWLKTYEVWGT